MTHAKPLSGRVALVTGASRRRGIGFATARELARRGADVFVHGYPGYDASMDWGADAGGMEAVAEELRKEGGRAAARAADFLDPEAPIRLLRSAAEALGPVDVLVANHAYSVDQPLAELDPEEIDRHLLVNVRATLLLVKAFAAGLPKGASGRVVLLTSGQHRGPMAGELAYVASKGAIHQLTASLAEAVAERGITLNAVNPGPTDTGWAGPELERVVEGRMPFGRWGAPEDAARLIAWLASDESAWVTGQVIDSEGGFRRG